MHMVCMHTPKKCKILHTPFCTPKFGVCIAHGVQLAPAPRVQYAACNLLAMLVPVRRRVQSRAWRLKSLFARRRNVSLGASSVGQRASENAGAVDAVAHESYRVLSTEFVAEHGVSVVMYEHIQSKAQVMSVQADDPNKVFGVSFLTPPTDSTGISHIMEHSVLCGSRKYTSKEPFAELLKGSLQTFLNAFTYPGRTTSFSKMTIIINCVLLWL